MNLDGKLREKDAAAARHWLGHGATAPMSDNSAIEKAGFDGYLAGLAYGRAEKSHPAIEAIRSRMLPGDTETQLVVTDITEAFKLREKISRLESQLTAGQPSLRPLTDVQIDCLAAVVAHEMPKPGVFLLTIPMLRKIIEAAYAPEGTTNG